MYKHNRSRFGAPSKESQPILRFIPGKSTAPNKKKAKRKQQAELARQKAQALKATKEHNRKTLAARRIARLREQVRLAAQKSGQRTIAPPYRKDTDCDEMVHKPITSKVTQSLSHGRSRTVEVQRQAANETKSGRKSGRPLIKLPRRKKKKSKQAAAVKIKGNKAVPGNKKKGSRKTVRIAISSRFVPDLDDASRYRKRKRRSRWTNPTTLSPGTPGNEDADPPVQRRNR